MDINFDYLTPKDWEGVFNDLPSNAPSTEETDSSSDSSFSDYYNDLFDRQSDFSNSPAEGWFEDFSRQSGQDFLSSGAQLITQNLQDVSQAFLNLTQQGLLSQVQEGNESITRPSPLTNDITGGLFQGTTEKYLDDLFGENDTISRDALLSNDLFYEVGIRLATTQQTAPSGDVTWVTTNQETIDSYVQLDKEYQQSLEEEEGSLEEDSDLTGTATVEETIGDEDYTTDLLPVPDLTPDGDKVEVTDVGGTELTGVDDTTESTYTLPENEPVDVTELTEEQQTSIWDKIKEGLGKIPEAIEKVIFGPDGIPSNVDEWIEWVDETLQAQMGPENIPFPIVITTNPQEGTWIDLKIPVDFDVNGTPIRIPLLDEDGNFVSSEELGKAWVDAKGQIFGPLGEIGEIFLDKDGNPTLDLGELKNVLLKDLTLNPDGSITGSTAGEILVGEWFFNSDTQEWEKEEVADINEDTVDNDTTDDDELKGLDEDPDEDPTPSAKPPRGNLITDKDGNPIRIIGEDGTNYVLDEDGQWVAAVVGEGEEGETVLQGTTTTIENNEEVVTNDDDEQVLTEAPELSEAPTFSNQDSTRVVEPPFQPEEPIIDTEDSGSVQVLTEAPVLPEVPVFSNQDSTRVVEPPFIPPDDPLVGTTDDPIVIPPDDPLVGTTDDPIVIPPDDPLVGTTDDPIVIPPDDPLVGTTPLTGGGGGGGRSLESGGYMGGLSYVLPEFVGVQYQPKNYNAELDRIINESLFKGMI